MKKTAVRLTVLCVTLLALVPVLTAQEPYKLPPKEVIDIVDGAITDRYVIPRCLVTSALETNLHRGDLALLPVEVEAIGEDEPKVRNITSVPRHGAKIRVRRRR